MVNQFADSQKVATLPKSSKPNDTNVTDSVQMVFIAVGYVSPAIRPKAFTLCPLFRLAMVARNDSNRQVGRSLFYFGNHWFSLAVLELWQRQQIG
jgi:hypothetical protein